MSQIYQSISSIKSYISWHNTGQEQQTGIDTTPFNDLSTQCVDALTQLSGISNHINTFNISWSEYVQNPSANKSNTFADDLVILKQESALLVSAASSIKSNAESLSGTINSRSNKLQSDIKNYHNDYQQASNDYNNAIAQYNIAQSKLSGSSGFWRGILTGITLGIDNKVKKEMDAANNAGKNAQDSMNRIQQTLNNNNNAQNALISCSDSLNQLSNLMYGITDLQNTINSVYAACQKGAMDEHFAASANSPIVIKVFIRQAAASVQSLITIGNNIAATI